jgi:hypothetical protein
MTTRQYARLVSEWIASIGLDPNFFGTHSLRRTKATLIYRRTGNLRAVQLLLGHTKIESIVRYLGIEVDDALAISEQITRRPLKSCPLSGNCGHWWIFERDGSVENDPELTLRAANYCIAKGSCAFVLAALRKLS